MAVRSATSSPVLAGGLLAFLAEPVPCDDDVLRGGLSFDAQDGLPSGILRGAEVM